MLLASVAFGVMRRLIYEIFQRDALPLEEGNRYVSSFGMFSGKKGLGLMNKVSF